MDDGRRGGGDVESDVSHRDSRIKLADAGISDASNDPVTQAVARASSENNPAHDKRVTGGQRSFWQTLGAYLSDAANSYFTEVGETQLNASDAEIATAAPVANAIAEDLKTYENYRAQPWIDRSGTPVPVPVFDISDPFSALGGLIEHELFEPNAPLTRPGTNADWVDPVVNAASDLAVFAGAALESFGTAGKLAAGASELPDNAPFIIRPSDLPSNFNPTLPVGRYVIPTNVVQGTTIYGDLTGEQIGRIVQNAFSRCRGDSENVARHERRRYRVPS